MAKAKKIVKKAPVKKPTTKAKVDNSPKAVAERKLLAKVKEKAAKAKAPRRPIKEAAERVLGRPLSGPGTAPSYLAPHGIVNALAGVGKTWSMVMGAAYMYGDSMASVGLMGRGAGLTIWQIAEKQLGFVPQPSEQQQEIWDFMAREKAKSIRYCAFNNSIVGEFGRQWAWMVEALSSIGVDFSFSTIHSLGNAAVKRAYGYKTKMAKSYKTKELLSAYWQKDLNEVWKEKATVIEAVDQLVALCKLTLAGGAVDAGGLNCETCRVEVKKEELAALVERYSVETNGSEEEIFGLVQVLLNQSRDSEVIKQFGYDFNDMVWLPVVNGLQVDVFDLLIVDEGQDLNRCQQELALRAGRRIILVGDKNQAIYGFAGADTDGIERMKGLLEYNSRTEDGGGRQVLEFELTVTRRCAKAVVREAQQYVAEFEAHPSNAEGLVARCGWGMGMVFIGQKAGPGTGTLAGAEYSLGETELEPQPAGHDMVICRVNAPIVRMAFGLLRDGRPFEYRGSDMKKGLRWFLRKSGVKADVSLFMDWLQKFAAEKIEKLNKRRIPDADAIATFQDKVDCLRTLAEGALSMKDMYKRIDDIFRAKKCPSCGKLYDEDTDRCWDKTCKADKERAGGRRGGGWDSGTELVRIGGPILSSIHRAKGLEAKRVFLLRPDLLPHPKAKTVWDKEQERHLQWVATTRAIETFVYVDGKGGKDECEE